MTPDRLHLDDALQRTLAPSPAPEALRRGLLKEARRRDRRTSRILWTGLAAAVLAGLGLWRASAAGEPPSGPRLAQAALADVVRGGALDFKGTPPSPPPAADPCRRWSKAALGYEAPLPRAADDCPLMGGRVCKVLGMRGACYLLKDGRSLFVFPKPIPKAGPGPGEVLAVAAGFQARAWNEGDAGVVMVEPMRP